MIVVIVQLWPAGQEQFSHEIGRMYIGADGGDEHRGTYKVAICHHEKYQLPSIWDPNGPKAARSGRLKNYPRGGSTVWRLISKALKCVFPEER